MNEYDAAHNHARLVAGEKVDLVIEAFAAWVNTWLGPFARQWSQQEGTKVDYDAFSSSRADARSQLIAAIRVEQGEDLIGEAVPGS